MRNLRVGTAIVSCFLRCRPVTLGLAQAGPTSSGIARPAITRFRSARLFVGAALASVVASGAVFLIGNTHSQAHAQAVVRAASSATSSAASSSSPSTAPEPQPLANAKPNDPDQELSQLFQMATDLKTEVGKTNQETLSVAVVRKAAAIEQFAHKVRTGGTAK